MRKLALSLILALIATALFAGDVANFVSLGFSPDGSRFAFGQYGRTDAEFRAFADLYAVDVAKNDFISGGKFHVDPAASTTGKDGKATFQEVQARAADFLSKQSIDAARQGRALYVQAENEPALKDVSFRDFESGNEYAVSVRTLSEGNGKNVRSSFYIVVTVTDAAGKKVSKTVGTPALKRSGVKDYLVKRIVTDDSGKSLVFVVEKTVVDKNGDSIRYMVETCRL